MTTAMIRCLRNRFPLAQIDMAVREDFLSLIQNNPHLDRKLIIKRNGGLKGLFAFQKEVNRQHYDLIYDAHRSLRTRLLMPFLRSSEKRFIHKHYFKRFLALTFKCKWLIKDSPRMLERFIEPLESLGVAYDGKGPEVFSTPEDATALAKRIGINPDQKYIGFIPSAQWPGKRWPLANFKTTLIDLLTTTQESVLVFGGPSDTFCDEITRDLDPQRVINLQGKLSLLEVFQVFQWVKCCLSNDTGLMHVADAMNIPNVVIFGPTHSDLGCRPFHPLSQVLERTLWCRPCSKNGEAPCIRSQRWCLNLITPDSALSALKLLLSQLSPDPTL